MDFLKFKPKNGEKYIIIENGEPVAVLISFEDYKKNFDKNEKEGFNQSELPYGSGEKEEFPKEIQASSQSEELKLEDLPF